MSVVDAKVAWASGTQGTFASTRDGGIHWRIASVPGADKLDFRDLHAFDGSKALLVSAGPGESSRIYRTEDAGETWKLVHQNHEAKGFFDAIAFWDNARGLVFGDPVGGKFTLLATEDGGFSWTLLPDESRPRALENEGAFAASGTCLTVVGDRDAWFATGGASVARVFHSKDRGKTWEAASTPIKAGNPSSGIFSLAFRDRLHGVAVGGDYQKKSAADKVAAVTSDGGVTWTLIEKKSPSGYRSAVAFVPDGTGRTWLTAGPSGTDISTDDGTAWKSLGTTGFHAIGFAPRAAVGWGVGEAGLVARWNNKE